MKASKFFLGLFVLVCLQLRAQVGINADNPTGVDLAINDDDTGIKVVSDGVMTFRNNNVETARVNADGFFGIGVTSPAVPLHVDAKNQQLIIENLGLNTSPSVDFLVVDPTSGAVGRRSMANTSGQIIRVGINTGFSPKGNPGNPGGSDGNSSTSQNGEFVVGFSDFDSPAEMGNSPAGTAYPNFINTITGANFVIGDPSTSTCTTNTSAGNAGNGAPDRCTDQIVLPAGIYRLTVRIVGLFQNSNSENSLDIKVIVNNNEYSYANGIISGEGSTLKSGYLVETLNLTQPTNTLDFTYVRSTGPNSGNYVELVSPQSIGGGNSFRNVITIERLQ